MVFWRTTWNQQISTDMATSFMLQVAQPITSAISSTSRSTPPEHFQTRSLSSKSIRTEAQIAASRQVRLSLVSWPSIIRQIPITFSFCNSGGSELPVKFW